MLKLIAIFPLLLIASCGMADSTEFTLYRTGISFSAEKEHDESLRIHIATFDASGFKSIEDGAKYNLANCELAQQMFTSSQPHYRDYRSNVSSQGSIKVKYWCEKGRFRK